MSELHHKMYHYEVKPPAQTWEKIASALDASDLEYQYPARLRDIELAPPAAAWSRIKDSLDAEKPTPVIPHRNFSPWIRYAAAAAVITLLAWGGITLLSNNKSDGTNDIARDEIVAPLPGQPGRDTQTALPGTESRLPDDVVMTDINAVTAEDARNDAALEASKKTYATLDVPSFSKLKRVSEFYFVPEEPRGMTRSIDFDYVPEPEEDLSDRYIMLMTPEGNIIRMSKKLGDLVCCVSGEEQDDDCMKQMKKWQDKMASTATGHAPGNIMDILGLLKSLQDNNH
jgi:hypothetical protein